MAATYGYVGEFSSDEDTDKLDQQHEQLAKFDENLVKLTKHQIEETIEAIKRMPIDQDVILSDELLAGLLDYYKTQRGPIVDSTRKLYKKIVLRQIRSELPQEPNNNAGGDTGSIGIKNSNSNNNFSKRPIQAADSFSSDDDEPLPPMTSAFNKKKFDSRYDKNDGDDDDDDVILMETEPDTPSGPIRNTKQVDISTTSTDDDDGDDSDESSDEDEVNESLNSESEGLEVTPIKPPANQAPEAPRNVAATPKQPESSAKRQPLAQSTPKETIASISKKPYTRSQRIAASRALASKVVGTGSDNNEKTSGQVSGQDSFQRRSHVSRRNYVVLTATLVIAVLAFLLYYFRSSNLAKSAESILSQKLKF